MSDIFIAIRNQDGHALTSIEGTVFVTILKQDGTTLHQKAVDLRYADAQFSDMAPGEYRAVARHPLVNPPEATADISLSKEELLQVSFIYLEPERQLLRIQLRHIPFDMSY